MKLFFKIFLFILFFYLMFKFQTLFNLILCLFSGLLSDASQTLSFEIPAANLAGPEEVSPPERRSQLANSSLASAHC